MIKHKIVMRKLRKELYEFYGNILVDINCVRKMKEIFELLDDKDLEKRTLDVLLTYDNILEKLAKEFL